MTDVSRREKFRTLLVAIGISLVAVLLAPPVVEAATQNVRVKNAVKVKDTQGDNIDSTAIPAQGITDVPGTNGAVSVRTFAGGNGVLGLGDCTEAPTHPLPQSVTIPGQHVISALIVTGSDGTVSLTSTAIGGGAVPLSTFTVEPGNQTETLALATGLGTTAPLTFAGTGTDCRFVILGQGEGVSPTG